MLVPSRPGSRLAFLAAIEYSAALATSLERFRSIAPTNAAMKANVLGRRFDMRDAKSRVLAAAGLSTTKHPDTLRPLLTLDPFFPMRNVAFSEVALSIRVSLLRGHFEILRRYLSKLQVVG